MKAKKILVMGLPGAGKTTLCKYLLKKISAIWLNADEVRREANDWDFSLEGRLRQAKRMKEFSNKYINEGKNIVADFICPTPETREDFSADYTVWVDTIKKWRFEDTNLLFIPPKNYNFRVTSQDADFWATKIVQDILSKKK